jgi:hypothetical protein
MGTAVTLRGSVFDCELQRQAEHARRLMLAARDGHDEFAAAAYDGRLHELEEIAARNGIRLTR